MATLGTYYFDGTNYSEATALYTDSTLSTLAPDGYYSNGVIVRRQLNGVLLNPQACTSCQVECDSSVSASIPGQNGWFSADVDFGSNTGNVIIYFYAYAAIPDGMLVTYSGSQINRLTCKNNNGSLLSNALGTTITYAGIDNQGTGLVTYVGPTNADLYADSPYTNTPGGTCQAGDAPENYTLSGGSYVAQGTTESGVTVTIDQVGTGADQVFTLCFNKSSAAANEANILVGAPMCGTAFQWVAYCPANLPSFQASAEQTNSNCAANAATYYFAPNATFAADVITPDTNTTPEVGNWVFEDVAGATYLNDTNTPKFYILDNTTYIKVQNGVVIETGNCS